MFFWPLNPILTCIFLHHVCSWFSLKYLLIVPLLFIAIDYRSIIISFSIADNGRPMKISYSWDILSGCNKNKMLANIILYYKSQSVCVSVCVSMFVRNRLPNHAYYGGEAFSGDLVGLGLGQRLNVIFKKIILRYFWGKVAPDEKKFCLSKCKFEQVLCSNLL